MFSWFGKRDIIPTLREQGGNALSGVRRIALDTVAHAESLLELFRVELKEFGQRQARRVALIVAGVGLLLVAYLLLCAALCVLLSLWLPLLAAIGIVFFINVLAGAVLLAVGRRMRSGPLAPATLQELKTDYQCLKISIGESRKS